MDNDKKMNLLKLSLRVFGVVFLLVYPISIVWPSGWVWHGGEGMYYFQMIVGIYAVLGVFLIIAAKDPARHSSLIWFTVWSSVVHALIMAVQALSDASETGHLVGGCACPVAGCRRAWAPDASTATGLTGCRDDQQRARRHDDATRLFARDGKRLRV